MSEAPYVRTPIGTIMHAENHRKAVEMARKSSPHMLVMLEPAEPVDTITLFASLRYPS